MPRGSSNSLINLDLGELSKPANTLILKVSEAVNGLFAPYQVKRIAKAKAEAEAALTKAHSEIELSDLQRRALHRYRQQD